MTAEARREHIPAQGFLHLLLAKGAAYAAPLLLASIWAPSDYGTVEAGYAIGLLIASICVSPLLQGMSHQYLTGTQLEVAGQGAGAVCLVGFIATSFAAILWLSDTGTLATMAALMTSLVTLQLTCSALLRIAASRYTPWAEGLIFLLLVPAALLAESPPMGWLVPMLLAVSFGMTLVAAVITWNQSLETLPSRIRASIRSGAPIAMYGMFTSWVGLSGRILVGLVNFAALPTYAVAFRILGLAAGVHTLVTSLFWARLYRANAGEADLLIARLLALAGIMSLLISLGGPMAVEAVRAGDSDSAGLPLFAEVLPIVALETFFWAGLSMLQPLAGKNSVASTALLPFAALALVTGGLIGMFGKAGGSIQLICVILACQAAGSFALALWALSRKHIYRRTMLVSGASGLLLLGCALARAS